MRGFLKAYVRWLRSLPDAFADWADAFVMSAHHPMWTGGGAPCRLCRLEQWPCKRWVDAAAHLRDRKSHEKQGANDERDG